MTKPRVRYRPGEGFYRVLRWNDGYSVVHTSPGQHYWWWREVLVGPFASIDDAVRVKDEMTG